MGGISDLADNVQVVPDDYVKSVKTGGNIESKYLQFGKYEVSYIEEETNENFKKYLIYYPSNIKILNDIPIVIFENGSWDIKYYLNIWPLGALL